MQEASKTPQYGLALSSLFLHQLMTIERCAAPSPNDRPRSVGDGMGPPNPLQIIFDAAAVRSDQLRTRQQAMELLQQKLISGSIRLVGRRANSNSGAALEWVPSEFWKGASISPEQDQAANGQAAYDTLKKPRFRRSRRTVRAKANVRASDHHRQKPRPLVPAGTSHKPIPVEVAPPKTERGDDGRPNMRERIQAKTGELWKTDEKFRNLPDRTAQAREVKAKELGEQYRNADEMSGCKINSAKRWVGAELRRLEAAAEQTA